MPDVLPVSNVINVSITNTPSGLTGKNVNSVALFTNEDTNSMNPYEYYVNPSQGAEDYGTDSLTYRMLNAMFAQSPNILSGDGRVVVIPLLASVSAIAGIMTTADLSANLAGIIGIANGDLRVTINTVNYDLTHLNFTNCTTWDDIAAILQARLPNGVVVSVANGIKISSKKVGTASNVALAAVAGGTGTNLNGAAYFNGANATTAVGVNSSGETILAAIERTKGAGFVPVMTTLDLEDAAVTAIAAGIQAQDMMFIHHFASHQDIAGFATANTAAGMKKTRPLLYAQGTIEDAKIEKAAYVGRGFSVDFDGSLTSQTMNLKQLVGIVPDSTITETLYLQADTAGIDLYVSYEGVPSVFSTGGNDYFDNPYSDLALKFALEVEGFNFLRQTNTKVPQTEKGMNGLKSAYSLAMERFVRNGCVAGGGWNSSETFGDPETFRQNIEEKGYYIYSIPVALQAASQREQRKAPLVQIAVKRAGAIHTSIVNVLVND